MKKILLSVVLLTFLFLFVHCSTDSIIQHQLNTKLTIIYTGNIAGYTQICGCRVPMGGLSRRATVLNELREETENILVLDAGALIYPKNIIYPPYDFSLRIIANLINDVMGDMGFNAINVTRIDLANGPDSLLAFDKLTQGNWLSANVVWRDSGELVFKPDAIYSVGDLRVGVFGFMDQTSVGNDLFKESDPVMAIDPKETVRKEIAKLSKESDLIIALAYMDIENVKKLVEEIDGIHVVIASHTRERYANSIHIPAEKVNNTIIVRCPDGGRVLGRLDLKIVNGSTEFTEIPEVLKLLPPAIRDSKVSAIEKSFYENSFIDLLHTIERYKPIDDKVMEIETWRTAFRDSVRSSDKYRKDFLEDFDSVNN